LRKRRTWEGGRERVRKRRIHIGLSFGIYEEFGSLRGEKGRATIKL